MTTLRNKIIDLKNIKEDDKIMSRLRGEVLSIQVDGEASISIKGSHNNFDRKDMHSLSFVDMGTLSKISTISKSGIYLVLTAGLDEVEFIMSGTGTVNIKELGE